MADTISTRDILAPFQTASALNELNDYFLLQANRTGGGGDGSQSAIRIPASLVKAYLMAGFEITINEDGYVVIGGDVTQTKIISELAARIVPQTGRTAAIAPNVLNKWGRMTSLVISELLAGPEGYANEYMMEFIVRGGNFTLTLPSGVTWQEEPDWEDGLTYQVSILNSLAVGAGWEAAEAPTSSSSSEDSSSSSSSDSSSSNS